MDLNKNRRRDNLTVHLLQLITKKVATVYWEMLNGDLFCFPDSSRTFPWKIMFDRSRIHLYPLVVRKTQCDPERSKASLEPTYQLEKCTVSLRKSRRVSPPVLNCLDTGKKIISDL